MVDILVLGATGFTGRLITRYLHNHPQRSSYTFALGVRSKSKGEDLKKSLGLDDTVVVVQVDVADYASVEAAVREVRVVINTVGPYWLWGDNVVRACAVHGKRYVDLAGELHFVKEMIIRYDYLASKTGAIIVPTCGFNCIAPDILVFLANRTLKNALGADAELGLSQTFYRIQGGVSGGSISTLLCDMEQVPRRTYERCRADYAISQVRGHPSPEPALAARMPFSSQYGGYWLGDKVGRGIVQRTFGLNALASSYTHLLLGATYEEKAVRAQTYGPQFRYTEYLLIGRTWIGAAVFSALFAFFMKVLFRSRVARRFVKLFMPKPGKGPSDEEMEKGWGKSVMQLKGDPGHLLTAWMISESALALALDDASLPVTARLGGVLTPATALGDALIRRLEGTGRIHFESEIVRDDEESRKDR
ncbi:Saccharopine dehydrogenase-domain-containing protein [Cerioporus squamosus]|nr:Saccharopine dehydrogenase-domain-containing protein [Cerioporus squamosus]